MNLEDFLVELGDLREYDDYLKLCKFHRIPIDDTWSREGHQSGLAYGVLDGSPQCFDVGYDDPPEVSVINLYDFSRELERITKETRSQAIDPDSYSHWLVEN